ncbi:beta-ketoacyl-[acyl-carrier-protein] synthase family protein [Streptomyces sp. ODS28]|uniref:beta-ketoacyl-[acyl-carrier-protein] synthase family protein n=1 Tax=Streptomyces sp. ODS28 TaxID=3136688 RepID=UPI0031E65C97
MTAPQRAAPEPPVPAPAVAELAVTGLGLVTAAGQDGRSTWEGVNAGCGLAARDPLLQGLDTDFSCAVVDWKPQAELGRVLSRRLDRPAQMAMVAAREAVEQAGLPPSLRGGPRLAVLIGAGTASFEAVPGVCEKIADGRAGLVPPTSLPRSLPTSAAAEVALDLGAQGPVMCPAAACASGAMAIGLAADLLRAGTVDAVLAGGAESGRSAISAVSFSQLGALSTRRADPAAASRPFDAGRDGFVLGEGAGLMLLERRADAEARGARPLAYLAGHGCATDAHHMVAPHPEGRGLRQALGLCMTQAGWQPRDVDHVNAHGTGTPLNDAVEARALEAVFGAGRVPPVTAAKGALGHTMGAGGAIEAALTVLTLHRQTIPPTANLEELDEAISLDVVARSPRPTDLRTAVSTSAAFGGHNTALAFRAAERPAPNAPGGTAEAAEPAPSVA